MWEILHCSVKGHGINQRVVLHHSLLFPSLISERWLKVPQLANPAPGVLPFCLGKARRVNSVFADYNASLSAAQGKLKHFDLLLIVSLLLLIPTPSFLATVKT